MVVRKDSVQQLAYRNTSLTTNDQRLLCNICHIRKRHTAAVACTTVVGGTDAITQCSHNNCPAKFLTPKRQDSEPNAR